MTNLRSFPSNHVLFYTGKPVLQKLNYQHARVHEPLEPFVRPEFVLRIHKPFK